MSQPPSDPRRPRPGPPPRERQLPFDRQQQPRRDIRFRPLEPDPVPEPKQKRSKAARKLRRQRIRRALRWGISLAVILGVLVGLDFGSAAVAEHQVATRMKNELQLSSDPSVRINDFPFLTQALGSEYTHIEVEADGVSVGPLADIGVEAELRGVHADINEIVRNELSEVKVDEVEGRVRITDRALGRVLGLPSLRLQKASEEEVEQAFGSVDIDQNDDDPRAAVRMIASTDADGEQVDAIVIALVEIVDQKIRITATDVRLGSDDVGEFSLPDAFKRPLLTSFSAEVDPGAVPFTAHATGVYVEGGSLVAEGTARDVTIDQAGIGFS